MDCYEDIAKRGGYVQLASSPSYSSYSSTSSSSSSKTRSLQLRQAHLDILYRELMMKSCSFSYPAATSTTGLLDDGVTAVTTAGMTNSVTSSCSFTPYFYSPAKSSFSSLTSLSSRGEYDKNTPKFIEDFALLDVRERVLSPMHTRIPPSLEYCNSDYCRRFLPNGPAKPSVTALYLSSLFPSSIPRISPHIVETLLNRLGFSPYATISLAGCIIDGLSSMFFINWLKRLPPDLDVVHPEVILLVCLALSIKFLDDRSASLKYFLKLFRETLAEFVVIVPTTIKDLVRLEMSILSDLNYDIMAVISNQNLEHMNAQLRTGGIPLDYPRKLKH